ncbi:hypothetical protein QBC39DRAFT_393082 [Podospora conica]|nr:hypothetical protein QBC39DRAFT_393082 [Schizothecium conicum]
MGTRLRTTLNTTKANTRSNTIFRRLKRIADEKSYDKIYRAYFTISSTAPFKVIFVGISPYKNRILPHFAAGLAYSAGLCRGSTPSVQLDNRFRSSRPYMDKNIFPTLDVYIARFAEMLRILYIYSEAGVVFVNYLPVITNTNYEESDIVEIHAKNDYKVTIISIGELPDETISDAFKSRHTITGASTIIRYKNPAQTAKLSVRRIRRSNPVPDEYTVVEKKIAKISGESLDYDTLATYKNMLFRALSTIVGLLASQAPHELGLKFISNITGIHKDFSTMSLIEVTDPTVFGDVQVDEDIHSDTEMMLHNEADIRDDEDDEDEDPFAEKVEVKSKKGRGKGYDRDRDSTDESGRKKKGRPFGVTKYSQFAQLVDPTGQAVSQQTIVIDNIRKSAADTVTMWKQTAVQVSVLNKSVKIHLKTYKASTPFKDEDITQCTGLIEEYENLIKSIIEKIEIACAYVEGLPAAVERDYGIYTKETQPTAPLMRRDNGDTMRNGVYNIVYETARDNQSNTKDQISVEDNSDGNQTPVQQKPTKKKKRDVSPAPSVTPSAVSAATIAASTPKEKGPMKVYIMDCIAEKAANSKNDNDVCMTMMKRKRNELDNRNGVSTLISFAKRLSAEGADLEEVKSSIGAVIECMNMSDESDVLHILKMVYKTYDKKTLTELQKIVNERE